MFCNNCGKEVGENSKFCNHCGYKFESQKSGVRKSAKEKSIGTCDYCGKEFDTKSELDSHEKKCDKNPNNTEDDSKIHCAECNIENLIEAKFCKNCGTDITRVATEKNDETKKENKNSKPGLTGWLALIGLGLIIGFFREAYGSFEYFSLLSTPYDVPGFTSLLQFEFIGSIAFVIFNSYVLYLYFKKNRKFPKNYVIYLIYPIVFSVVDLIWLGSLTFPTQEQKQLIDDTITKNSSDLFQSVVYGIIWTTYVVKSKQVKITFVNRG